MFHRLVRKSARLLRGRFGSVGGLPLPPPPESRLCRCDGIHVPCLHWPGSHEGEPLILVHGLLSNPWIWARLASLLRCNRPVWAPALRGHGALPASDAAREESLSGPGSGVYQDPAACSTGTVGCTPDLSLDATTRDLLSFLDVVGLRRVALTGHSWGGKIAVHFAAHHPERVSRLILADPVLPAGFNRALRRFPGLATAGFAPERRSYPDRASMEAAHAEIVYLFAWDEADRTFWTSKFAQQPDGSFVPTVPDHVYREILDVTLQEDTSHLLPRVACPVLLMRPTFTVSFWPGEVTPLRKALRKRLVEKRISGDHTFVHSNPLDTADAMERFLVS